MASADLKKIMHDTPDHTGDFSPEDIEKNKLMGILCYIWILWLIPLFAAKDSKFARFHVNQGIVLFIIETILGIIMALLGGVFFLGVIVKIVGWLIEAASIILAILGIYNAVTGTGKELPFIGGYSIIK